MPLLEEAAAFSEIGTASPSAVSFGVGLVGLGECHGALPAELYSADTPLKQTLLIYKTFTKRKKKSYVYGGHTAHNNSNNTPLKYPAVTPLTTIQTIPH